MTPIDATRRASLLAALLVLTLLASCTTPQAKPEDKASPVPLRILAFNDFHGNLVGPTGTVEVAGQKLDAGGVAYFASHLDALRQDHPHTITACAGDLIGASPLISAMFHDEPTIEAMDLLGLDLCAVGNHEFDDGFEELMRIQQGGCHPQDGCQGKERYDGAKFQFLGANVVVEATGQTLLPPYAVRQVGPVKVGFIGLTLEGTPAVVSPGAIVGLRFDEEVATINRYVEELVTQQGVHTIIVLIHEGGYADEVTDVNDCNNLKGPIVPIAERVDPRVAAIVTGHSHQLYNCRINERPVTSAKSFGRAITVLDLTIDPKTGRALTVEAKNHPVTIDVPAETRTAALVEHYKKLVGPLAQRVIGKLSAPILRDTDDAGQSPLGMLIADAQLAATSAAPANAQLALMNLGGVRDSLRGDESGGVNFEMLHRTQPFGNTLVTMTLTGAEIKALLEQQFQDARPRILQPSAGFSFAWRADAPAGQRIDPQQLKLHGKIIAPEQSYRVTINSFLSTGGDGFTTLKQGRDLTGGPVDLEALVQYVQAQQTLVAPKLDRVIKLSP